MGELVSCINAYATQGQSDAIYSVHVVPRNFITKGSTSKYGGDASPKSYTYNFNKPTTINGYTPKNNKLLTFPYRYLLMSNNSGTSNILHYERFSTTNCTFDVKGVPVVGCSIKCSPKSYDGVTVNEENGIIAR